MHKTILITGATDGIGLETARHLAPEGHRLLLHGRSEAKLEKAAREIAELAEDSASIETLRADLSDLAQVEQFAGALASGPMLDVVIHNAGVFNTSNPRTPAGLDVRFVVNTIAPYVVTRRLLPKLGSGTRVVNLSSAAQSPVDLAALRGEVPLGDQQAYAQSKLAVTMWSRHLAQSLGSEGPTVVAVNPGSLLATKMVHQAFGVPGSDIRIGADILRRAALSDEFGPSASGQYYDNDSGRFAAPHPDALNANKCEALVRTLDELTGMQE